MMTECFSDIVTVAAAAALLVPCCMRYDPHSVWARWLHHGVKGLFLLTIWNSLPWLPQIGMNPLSIMAAGGLGVAGAAALAILQ